MRKPLNRAALCGVLFLACGLAGGCGDSDDGGATGAAQDVSSAGGPHKGDSPPVLSVSDGSHSRGESARTGTGLAASSPDWKRIHNALKPLQALIGRWRGVTQKTIGGAAGLEEPVWTWDFLTEPQQPALVVSAETSPYLKSGRLTWLADEEKWEFTARDRLGSRRVYRGTFTQPQGDLPGRDGSPQGTFRLELDQVSPPDLDRLSRVVFIKQDPNRYLMEVYDREDGEITRYDTVVNQLQGPSPAVNGNATEENTCIMLHGPGTIPVEHGGERYWVCCPGCRAAFEDDPDYWTTRFRHQQP